MNATPVYICPMHASVREPRPGPCPTCGMDLVPEGARFALLRHMLGSPVRVAIMASVLIVVMAAGTMIVR